MDEVGKEDELDGVVLGWTSARVHCQGGQRWKLTDLALKETCHQALGELDKSKDDKVGQEGLGALLVGAVERAEGEEGGREEGEELGGGKGKAEEVEGDKKEVARLSALSRTR